jgi:pantoate--beta-alanine ligase
MKIITDIAKMQEFGRQVRLGGLSLGLVPTMGYLHDGHLELVRRARAECDVVVVSIFVNPTQFNNPEDFEKYPRDDERDAELLVSERTDVLFMPDASEVYMGDAATTVAVGGLTASLCGPGRPGHFEGVATIVASLFNMVGAEKAFFGEKDIQQLQVIRRMVRDLHMPVEIVGVPTCREADGLAMSSRNARLTREHREVAPVIYRALNAAVDAYIEGEDEAAALLDAARVELEGVGELELEYLELVDAGTMKPVETADENSVMAVAAFFGSVRLIDNILFARALAPDATAATCDTHRVPDVIEYGSH